MRLKAVKNIQKITKSMKMVAAAKYAKAERELRPAKVFGEGAAGGCGHNHYYLFYKLIIINNSFTTQV